MTCHNHPNVRAVGTCSRCEKELCGVCVNLLDTEYYCEKCAGVVESERFVSAKSELYRKSERVSFATIKSDFPVASPSHTGDRGIIWLGIGGSASMLFFSMILYAYPSVFEFDPDAAAVRKSAQALEDCRLVFEEIGYMLEDGQIPDPSLRCPESDLPNIVTRSGELVRVSHPDPALHGVYRIYVTSASHEVMIEE